MSILINPYSFGGIDPDLLSYISILPNIPTTQSENIIGNALSSLKAGSNNWDKLDLFALMSVDFRENAYYSLVNPSLFISHEEGNMLWNQHGFKGNTASYLPTDFTPSIDGVNYQDGSACFFYWSLTDVNDSNMCDIGCQPNVSGGNKSIISFARGSNTWYSSINDDSNSNIDIAGITSSIGFYSVVRSGQTVTLYKNGVQVHQETYNRTGLPELEVWAFGLNANGSLSYNTTRQLACYGFGSGDIDQAELYASAQIYVDGMQNLYPSPPAPSVAPISSWYMDLQFPALTDVSGNGLNASLSSPPSGLTAPSFDGNNNLVFNGLNGFKLNASFTLSRISNSTVFMLIDTDSPEDIMNLINLGTQYRASLMVNAETLPANSNKYVTAGICYFDEGATDRPLWGKSLPKLQSGRNVVGFSFSNNGATGISAMYLNKMVSYFQPDNSYGAGATSGTIGAFPGGSSGNAYTVPAYFSIPSGGFVKVLGSAANTDLFQATGDMLMEDLGLNLIVFELDSITAGATLSTNAETYSDITINYLISQTATKWSGCNMAIPGRTLQAASTQDLTSSAVSYYNVSNDITIRPVYPVTGANNVVVLLGGVNDIAIGRTLSDLQTDFTAWVNFRNEQGFNVFVLTVTGDISFTGGQNTILNNYNSWLQSQQVTLNFTYVDISGVSIVLNDTVHWNAATHTAVAAVLGPEIFSNL